MNLEMLLGGHMQSRSKVDDFESRFPAGWVDDAVKPWVKEMFDINAVPADVIEGIEKISEKYDALFAQYKEFCGILRAHLEPKDTKTETTIDSFLDPCQCGKAEEQNNGTEDVQPS